MLHSRRTHRARTPNPTSYLHVQPTPLDHAALLAKANTVRRTFAFVSRIARRTLSSPVLHAPDTPQCTRQHKCAGDAYRQHRSFGAAKKQCVSALLHIDASPLRSGTISLSPSRHKRRAQVPHGVRSDRQSLPSQHTRGAALALFREIQRTHWSMWSV